MDKLKPCPFCGNEAEFVILDHVNGDTTQWHKVKCKDTFGCGAELGDAISFWSATYDKQVDDLISRWNRRPNARNVGLWIRREKVRPNLPDDSDYEFECSCCGWRDLHNANMIVPYCWHCGAKMEVSEDA